MPKEVKSHRSAMGFILLTLLIDVTGLGIIIPVFPKLLKEMGAGSFGEASIYGGWLLFSFSITQFLFSPVLGNLSDRFGRRPVLLFSLLGFGLDYLFLAFAPTLAWLFVGRIIAGITGASYTAATAYIADITPPEKRAQNFGLVGAAFGIGFIIGPVMGGLLGHLGTRIPFIAAAILTFLNFIYGFLVLPESLSPDKRRAFNWKRANPVGSLLHLKKYPVILPFLVALFFIYLGSHAIQSNWTFYTMEKFSWDEQMVGLSLGFVGILVALVQGLLIRWINPKLGNNKSIYLGLCLYILGYILFAFAEKGSMMFVALIPYCLGGIAAPAIQGLVSSQVPSNEQGELQGTSTSMISLTSIIGPPVMTGLFALTTSKGKFYFPGSTFLLAAVLTLISLLLIIKALRIHHHHTSADFATEEGIVK